MPRLTGFAGRALGRISADPGLQLDDVDELVGLAAQLIGNHRRLRRGAGDHANAHPAAHRIHMLKQSVGSLAPGLEDGCQVRETLAERGSLGPIWFSRMPDYAIFTPFKDPVRGTARGFRHIAQ